MNMSVSQLKNHCQKCRKNSNFDFQTKQHLHATQDRLLRTSMNVYTSVATINTKDKRVGKMLLAVAATGPLVCCGQGSLKDYANCIACTD